MDSLLRSRRQSINRLGLAAFVEATTSLTLDPWQEHLCSLLERLRLHRGLRILLHAPPQFGKSVIVSQRLPAWLLGHLPEERIKLSCYNITHATRFGKIVLQLMQSREYEKLFPSRRVRVPDRTSAEEWSTAGRAALMDAQPSFKALGLATGFVGQGADTLIIDDPYASPQDAYSELVRQSVWTFWEDSARPRLNERSNVVVMFHRYHEDDLAGKLYAGGGWEMHRFSAMADGDASLPEAPDGRAEGEVLSPRFSPVYYAEQQKNGYAWLSQFQGRPTSKEGLFFKVSNLEIVDAAPAGLTSVRAWDYGATAGAGDPTAGVRMGTRYDGNFYIEDVAWGQWATDERDRVVRQTAALDGRLVRIRGAQDPGQAGKDQALAFTRMLAGYSVKTLRVSGPKETRADPFSSQVNAGNVKLVAGPWNAAFIEELRQFPLGRNDDQVDAASDAFEELTSTPPPPRRTHGGAREELAGYRKP